MRNNTDSSDAYPCVRWLAPVVALGLLAWLPLSVLAQDVHGWRQRPSGRELTAPEYAKPAPALPLEAPPTQVDEPPLSRRERVFVRRFELSGNTVFTGEELAAVTAPYENGPSPPKNCRRRAAS